MEILVIMPCYNHEEFVTEAIESIMTQEFTSFRLVCCDDCSTDNTYQKLLDLKNTYDFDLIQTKSNLGTGGAVHYAISESLKIRNYPFITWVSSDNIYHTNFLLEHHKLITQGFAITYSFFSTQEGKLVQCNFDLSALSNEYRLGPSFLFRKALYDAAGPFHDLPGEDYYFAVKCIQAKAKFGFIEESLMTYRYHENSVSGRLKGTEIPICSQLAKELAKSINLTNGELIYDN